MSKQYEELNDVTEKKKSPTWTEIFYLCKKLPTLRVIIYTYIGIVISVFDNRMGSDTIKEYMEDTKNVKTQKK